MLKRILMSAVTFTAVTNLMAQADTLWFKSNDRFTPHTYDVISSCDSIEFGKEDMAIYNKPGRLPKVRTKTYKTDGVYMFANPGRIIYRPNEFSSMDFYSEDSRWCFQRSKESEHFIVFWEPGFGLDPKLSDISLDVDLVLSRAEMLFDFYANELGFVIPGNSKSTDKYKIEIFVNYSNDWLATGSGYDDKIGALWCTPWALSASGGHTIGHEIGHSFQYLVSCDLGTSHGWRWGFGEGGSGGCAWWESCAQWQAFKVYPDQQFNNNYYAESINSAYKNLLHEDWRYANYFIQDYWVQLHGMKFIGKLWRASTFPGDPIETYKRITGVNQAGFNDEFFDYARRAATWDIDGIRERGKDRQDAFSTELTPVAGTPNTWQVAETCCPQNYGMNIIKMKTVAGGTAIKAGFKGIAGAEGYRAVNVGQAGWRYGFCSLLADGTRDYGEMYSNAEGVAEYTVPETADKVWFVVTGAPTKHWRHPWNDDVSDDEQWPYQVAFENVAPYGTSHVYGEFADDYVRKDTTVVINAELARSTSDYSSVRVQYDTDAISEALGLSTEQLKTVKASSTANPRFAAVNANGSLVYTPLTTTSSSLTSTSADRKYGHWFNTSGNVCSYGPTAAVFAEWYPDKYGCYVGQYPGKLIAGRTYVIRHAIVYKHTDGKTYRATMEVHLKVK